MNTPTTPTSPTELPRELVLASAGSGKTYPLSSRIIELLASGAPPGDILASTFTRKAAGEILDRVLVRDQAFTNVGLTLNSRHCVITDAERRWESHDSKWCRES